MMMMMTTVNRTLIAAVKIKHANHYTTGQRDCSGPEVLQEAEIYKIMFF